MKQSLYIVIPLVLVIAIVGVVSMARSTEHVGARIGLISSQTGDFGAIGQNFSKGVQFAYEQYKKAHPSDTVELYSEDDGTDPKKALSAYNKLTSLNHVDALINLSSPSINIIYDAVTKSGIPVIQVGEQDIAPAADSVYQIYPTQDAPEVATGEYLKSLSKGNDTVLFYTNDSTVINFVANIKKGYGEAFSQEFKLDPTQQEYRTIVAEAMAKNPKYVVISAYTENGARITHELLKYPNHPTIIYDLTYDAEYKNALSAADLGALDGSLAMSLKQDLDPTFVQKYKAEYGTEPDVFAGYGYDAFNTLIAGYNKDSINWVKNISKLDLQGATGHILFDEKGLRPPEYAMKQIEGGKLVNL